MALPATGVLEVRGGAGNDANAGGFVPGGGGTDRSQSDTPHVTFDGATIAASNGGTSATITLAGYTVIAGDIDNYVRIAGGTNFVTGVYRIASVNTGSNTWTLDRNCTSGAGSAMTGRMGGALATIAQAWADAVDNNQIWVKQATYTYTSAITTATTVFFRSYQTTRGDRGRSTITTSTNSVAFHAPSSTISALAFRNFNFTNTAGTPAGCLSFSSFVHCWSLDLDECSFDGFTTVIAYSGTSSVGVRAVNVEIANCTGIGLQIGTDTTNKRSFLKSVYIHDCGGDGINWAGSIGNVLVCVHVVVANCGGDGMDLTAAGAGGSGNAVNVFLDGCVLYKNAGHGIKWTNTAAANFGSMNVFNSVFWDQGGYGFSSDQVLLGSPHLARSNAYGDNTSGARQNVPAGDDEVTLTVDPFTDGDAGDFTLNSTSGGGADLKGAGFPNDVPA